MKPLSYFLQTSMLSTDTDADKNDLSSNLVSPMRVSMDIADLMTESDNHYGPRCKRA